jgi:Fe-S oxidoreductase
MGSSKGKESKVKYFKEAGFSGGHSGYPKRYNHICEKHGYTSRFSGLCPICRVPLSSLGDRFRVSRDAKKIVKTPRKHR